MNLDNVTHEDAVSALKASGERVVLVLIPGPRSRVPSPAPTSRAHTRKFHINHCYLTRNNPPAVYSLSIMKLQNIVTTGIQFSGFAVMHCR